MIKKKIRDELRIVIDDLERPYAWTDEEVDMYCDEACDIFCERTGFFVDFKNYTIVTEEDEASYSFDPDGRIIELLELWNSTTGIRLSRFGEDDRPDFVPTIDVQVTQPYMFQTDQNTGDVTLYPTPGEVLTFNARVWRRCRTAYTDLTDTETPEIPKSCHNALVEYAAFKCYSQHDREKANEKQAATHLAMFEMYIARGKRLFQAYRGTHPQVRPNKIYAFR